MSTLSKILFLSTLVALSACAALPTTIKPQAGELTAINNATVTIIYQQTQDFMFTTPSTALVDADLAEWVEPDKAITWSKVLRENKVPDFTEAVAKTFKKQLHNRFDFEESAQVEPFDQSADFSRLTTKYNTDYVLEVRTLFGSLSYGPLSWQTYHLHYAADIVIVRVRDQVPVWKIMCSIGPGVNDALKVPGKGFLSGDGRKLRTAAEQATTYCGKQLAQEFLDTLKV